MANLIGGIAPFLGLHNRITGTGQTDAIFGDPFTTGNTLGVPEIGGPLSALDEAGNDTLNGVGGNDSIFGDAWTINAPASDLPGEPEEVRGGDDEIQGGSGRDTLYGDAFNLISSIGFSSFARGGDDRVAGGAQDDTLYGDAAGFSGDNTTGGNDRLFGDSGNDLLYGDAADMPFTSTGGHDELYGGSGADALYGDADILVSSSGGDDTLRGGPEMTCSWVRLALWTKRTAVPTCCSATRAMIGSTATR